MANVDYLTSLILGTDKSTFAHVHTLMGCFTLARSKDRAFAKLQSAIPEYQRWLKSHGEDARIVRRPKTKIIEEIHVKGNAGRAGGPDPLFACDKTLATQEHVRRCLQLLKYTRADLLGLISKTSKRALDWKPLHEPRTARNTLQHIAEVDIWYLSRIRADALYFTSNRPRDIFKLLEYARSVVHETVPRLTEAQLRNIFYQVKWSGTRWPWTATKVLHRLVTRERQHTLYLKKILSLPDSPDKMRNLI